MKKMISDAISSIDEKYLIEAQEYRTDSVKRPAARFSRLAAIAAVFVVVFSSMVLAANMGWAEQIRQWLGISDTGADGYVEFADETAQSDAGEVTLLSEFCSGNRLILNFSVTAAEEKLDLDLPWHVQFLVDEDKEADRVFYENLLTTQVNVLSSSPDEVIVQLVLLSDQLETGRTMSMRLYQYDEAAEEAVFMPELEVPIVESAVLQVIPELDVHNDLADSDGVINCITVNAGNIELTLSHEYVEQWCTRVCVPDQGKRFMESYTGETWVPGDPEEPAYFTLEDEQAIFAAYSETWEKTMEGIIPTVQIIMKDGTTLTLEGDPEIHYSTVASTESSDAYVYGWTLNPVLELENVAAIEILGQTYSVS